MSGLTFIGATWSGQTAAMPSGIQVGDLLLLGSTSGTTLSAGYAMAGHDNSYGFNLQYKLAVSSDIGGTLPSQAASVAAYRGIKTLAGLVCNGNFPDGGANANSYYALPVLALPGTNYVVAWFATYGPVTSAVLPSSFVQDSAYNGYSWTHATAPIGGSVTPEQYVAGSSGTNYGAWGQTVAFPATRRMTMLV